MNLPTSFEIAGQPVTGNQAIPPAAYGDPRSGLLDETRPARIAAAEARGDHELARTLRFVEARRKQQYVGPSKNLWEQMNDGTRFAVAQLLGFKIDFNHDGKPSVPDQVWLGFKLNMQEIPPLPGDFTIGDAKRAYLMHLLNR